jgi:hypothetical protein
VDRASFGSVIGGPPASLLAMVVRRPSRSAMRTTLSTPVRCSSPTKATFGEIARAVCRLTGSGKSGLSLCTG